MSWKDRLRPASFRGEPFRVGSIGSSGGRRLAIFEYPGRDDPYVEDLGRKGRRYTISGYVLDDDYEAKRDALIAACESAGEATLVHPTFGEITAACEAYEYEETKEEGGIVRFTFSFVEAGENKFPRAGTDTVVDVERAALSADGAIAAAFDRAFEVARWPGFVAAAAASRIEDMAALVAGLALGPASGVEALARRRTELAALLTRVAGDPLGFAAGAAGAVIAMLDGARRASATPRTALAALEEVRLFASSDVLPPAATPSRAVLAANASALEVLIDRAALAAAARAASAVPFASYDEAVSLRTRLTGALADAGTIAADRGEHETWRALKALAVAVSADITARGGSLARLVPYDTGTALPSVVLAYRLYGDAGRAGELENRNSARHPLFMPVSGQALSA